MAENVNSLPESFVSYTRRLLGDADYAAFAGALESEAPVTVRPNPLKPFGFEGGSPVPWAPEGHYLQQRPTFTFDPLFHAGCYYVQEAASMFVSQVLRHFVTEPVRMLDLCAAPGGKSTLCRSLLPEGSLLVANEVMRARSQVLAENLIKWGHPDTVVTSNDPADFAPLMHFFDVILTDVPCSGEGMFRKDPVAVKEWSPENVDRCVERQRRILSDIWHCLTPGGLLIYSTCTYNLHEDEENVHWLQQTFGAQPLDVPVSDDWHITGALDGSDLPVYHFLPHRTQGEGFFLALLRKPAHEPRVLLSAPGAKADYSCAKADYSCAKADSKSDRKADYSCSKSDRTSSKSDRSRRKKGGAPVPSFPEACRSWITHPEEYRFETDGTLLTALPLRHADSIALLRQSLHVLHAGIPLGEVKVKDIQPSHALALSAACAREAFPQTEVSYREAIAYLRKEAVVLPPDLPRGYVLLTYKGQPLGFEKNIGNRANNLYPQEWRIRSGYLPDPIICL